MKAHQSLLYSVHTARVQWHHGGEGMGAITPLNFRLSKNLSKNANVAAERLGFIVPPDTV